MKRFLAFVKELRPKYWVMENVPNLLPLLEEGMTEPDEFTLGPGSVSIPNRKILDSAQYGVPQHRRRMFSGRFPTPPATHGRNAEPFVALVSILSTLPDPTMGADSGRSSVRDPVYPGLKFQATSLRDHFEDRRWKLSLYDRQRAKQQKTRHAVYGKMSYPDDIDRPCRTITATRTTGSRSTIVVPFGTRNVRTLTMREAACAQGFPISYQFWATLMNDKDVLAGNAVPPPIARAIGEAIRIDMGLKRVPLRRIELPSELPRAVEVRFRTGHWFSPRRHYHGVVPIEWRHDHRVELDNKFTKLDNSNPVPAVAPDWRVRLYLGYAKDYVCYEVRWVAACKLAGKVVADSSSGVDLPRLASLLQPLAQTTLNGFPDAAVLQDRWTGQSRLGRSPDALCEEIARAVERAFPSKTWRNRRIAMELTDPILETVCVARGDDAGGNQPLPMEARLLASTIALALYCERLDNGTGVPSALLDAISGGEKRLADYLVESSRTNEPQVPKPVGRSRAPREI